MVQVYLHCGLCWIMFQVYFTLELCYLWLTLYAETSTIYVMLQFEIKCAFYILLGVLNDAWLLDMLDILNVS